MRCMQNTRKMEQVCEQSTRIRLEIPNVSGNSTKLFCSGVLSKITMVWGKWFEITNGLKHAASTEVAMKVDVILK